MRKIRQYCPALHIRMKAVGRFIQKGTMEDVTPPGGHTRRKLTSNEKVSNNTLVRDHGKTYEFILKPAEKEGRVPNEGINATTVFVMLGKVVKTSIGHAEGNKVTVKNMNYVGTGFPSHDKKVKGHQAAPRRGRRRGRRARLVLAGRLHTTGAVFLGGDGLALAPDSLSQSAGPPLLPGEGSVRPEPQTIRQAGCLPDNAHSNPTSSPKNTTSPYDEAP